MARIVIAGGSLGGLMTANLMARAGHEVTVLERVEGPMQGRGAGIVTHAVLVDGLRRCGMPADFALGVPVPGRITLDTDGTVLGEMALPQVLTSWSLLYSLLRDLARRQSAIRYLQGVTVRSVSQDADHVLVTGSHGSFEADLLVAADGIRSAVRQQFWPQVQPEYVGYVAWRGLCDEAALSARTHEAMFERFGFCLPPGEQLVGYPVAGPGDSTMPGRRAWNFVWYRPADATPRLVELMTDDDGVHHPLGIAPAKVSRREVARMREDARRLLAPPFVEIIENCHQPFLQPIFDVWSDSLAQGRVALLGDAAFVARPHVGMGVAKAMQDATALVDVVDRHGASAEALRAYERDRLPAGQAALQRARRLGAYMRGCGQGGSVQPKDARYVMAETAIDLEHPPPEAIID